MITLNSEKGLTRVEEWAEIESRPGFVKDLDPLLHKLAAIIGRYAFKDKIRCGLSTCHTPHGKGYLVATHDGHETNIGKDCGKTHFGVDFESLSRQFDRDITAKENRERLWSFAFRLEEVEAVIAVLRSAERGADWVYKNSRPLVTPGRGCPSEVVNRISNMVKTRTNVLVASRPATKQEVEDLEAIEGRTLLKPHYIDEPIAEVAGLPALFPENDLRADLVLGLQVRIGEFRGLAIDDLAPGDLQKWVKWIDGVDSTLDKAKETVEQGKRLLTVENLQPISRVLTSRDDLAEFRAYLRTLD